MIKTIVNEGVRGCGYRKSGGTYLITDGKFLVCNKLPMPLSVCPCCGAGIKATRGWTWVNGKLLADQWVQYQKDVQCGCGPKFSGGCILLFPDEKVGLLWIGESFYKTPDAFMLEAHKQGISRRISRIPHGFKVGETQIWLAHRKAVTSVCPDCFEKRTKDWSGETLFCDICGGLGSVKTPGVFTAFIPQRIEYIITGKESKAELDRKEKAGITLIKLERTDGKE